MSYSVPFPVLQLLKKNPAFARLWASQVVSQAGDWLNRVACLTLIGTLGGSTSEATIGILFGAELALRLLPPAAMGSLAGPVADRLPRRLLMVVADLVRALVVAAMYFVREPDDLPWLYALLMLQMGVSVFFDAARSAAIPDTVARDELHRAHAISAATWSVMLSVGALAGGGLASWIGVRNVFLVDAVSYVVSALFLIGLVLPPVPKHTTPFRWRDVVLLRELGRGFEHARGLGLATSVAAKTFWGGAGGFLVVLAIAGHERFGARSSGDPAGDAAFTTGILYAARGLGTGVGPFVSRHWLGETDRALRAQITLGFAIAAVGYALFGFAQGLVMACVWVAVAHLGGASLWTASTVLWQRHVHEAFRGRVFSVEFLGANLSFAAHALIAGLLYDATHSLAVTIWCCAALVLVSGTAWTILSRRGAQALRG